MEIAVVGTIYIDNDRTYNQAKATLCSMVSDHHLRFYGRVSKLEDQYGDILTYFDHVVKNDENILSRSWNQGTEKALKDGCDYVILPNLDIKLFDDTIDNLVKFAQNDDSVMWSGRCLNTGATYPQGDFIVNSYTVYDNFSFFMINDRLFDRVGKFDEKFIPCYGEDVDIQYRMELAGEKHTCVADARFIHYGQTTANNSPDWIGKSPQDQAHEYFEKKWGGFPREHKFKTPFNE